MAHTQRDRSVLPYHCKSNSMHPSAVVVLLGLGPPLQHWPRYRSRISRPGMAAAAAAASAAIIFQAAVANGMAQGKM